MLKTITKSGIYEGLTFKVVRRSPQIDPGLDDNGVDLLKDRSY